MDYSPYSAYERYLLERKSTADKYELEPVSRDEFLVQLNDYDNYDYEHRLLDRLPVEERDAEVCIQAVDHLPDNIRFVPEQYLTEELCLKAVLADGLHLYCIPRQYRTPEVCYAALAKGTDTRFVPESIPRDHKFYMLAVAGWGANLESVPPEEITPALCYLALNSCGHVLDSVPPAMLTWGMCLAAVQNDGTALEDVPEKWRTEEICLEAVLQDHTAAKYVPPAIRTPQFWGKVLKKDPFCLSYIPEEELTEEALLQMFSKRRHGYQFREIPKSLRTEAVCIAAVRADADNLKRVPSALKERVKQAL